MKKFLRCALLRRISLGTVIILFSTFILLDTFVIPHSYVVLDDNHDVTEEDKTSVVVHPEIPVIPEVVRIPIEIMDSYSDNDITVVLKKYREFDTDIYLADIRISSPEYLKCAFAHDTYGRNITEKTSAIAERVGAIVAVNGDFYGSRMQGYVVRNGEIFRSVPDKKMECLLVQSDGSFKIVEQGAANPLKKLCENGILHAFTFGPGLVLNSEISVGKNEDVEQHMNSNPRTAMAYCGNGRYLLMVSDGRTEQSDGLSLYELGGFLRDLGAESAYNLDGGGSSTMYFKGELISGKVVNYPTTHGQYSERSVSDIVYIGY